MAFTSLLRKADVPVPVGTVITYTDALGAVGIEERDAVYWAGRATLVRRPEDVCSPRKKRISSDSGVALKSPVKILGSSLVTPLAIASMATI